MKIKIKNLGPIYEFNFDLNKDLHLVYGKNNIGKSHGIAAVYLILKTFSEKSYLSAFEKAIPQIKTLSKDENGKTYRIKNEYTEFNNLLQDSISLYFNATFLWRLKQSFSNSFSELTNIKNGFSKDELLIDFYLDLFDIQIGINEDLEFFIKSIIIHNETTSLNPQDELPSKQIVDLFEESLKNVFNLLDNIYFLPASRSGLYQGMNATAPILAQMSKVRNFFTDKTLQIPTFSEPVSDYFLQLMSVNTNGKSDVFNRIAETIENDILQGTIVFNNQNKKYEYVQNRTDLRFDVTSASSMISELAPFVAFLKYILKEEKGDNKTSKCLFIEEPEAHLHPSVQVVLMQLFTEMATHGVKIIMTTHSDFMFNELSNLILDNKIKAEQVSSMHLVMTEKGSIDKGDMQATSDGIDDYNFSEVAENQYERRMNLLDLKNQ
jgi:predicted ATPase